MQSVLTDIIDYVWDLADLAIEYGQLSDESNIAEDKRIMQLCGLTFTFMREDITHVHSENMELHLMWRRLKGSNDNQLDKPALISDIFPESATFIKGDIDTLKEWHSDLLPLRGSLVA